MLTQGGSEVQKSQKCAYVIYEQSPSKELLKWIYWFFRGSNGLACCDLEKKSFQSSFIFQAFQPYYYNEDIICLTPNGCISGIQKLIYEEYLTSRSDTVAPLSGPAAFVENFNIKPEEQTQGSECKFVFFCLISLTKFPKNFPYGLLLCRSCLLNEEFFFQCQINFSPFTFSTTAIYFKQVWPKIQQTKIAVTKMQLSLLIRKI